ncbi:MAG: lipid-A-disaccharide synthase [Alphaproteobacteria bacterium]
MKYFLIAGEPSGDVLGGKLMASLKAQDPEAEFVGIGGSLMIERGLNCLLPMSELTIMGIWEVIMRLPQLFKMRDAIVEEIEKINPDAFITVDFPDFNFQVAKRLRKRGKVSPKLIHYVAPTVWAWRPGRAKSVARFLDVMICLFPFEPDYFKKHGLRAVHVGHPLIEDSPDSANGEAFRRLHEIPKNVKLLGLFFGSRESEIEMNAAVIKEAAQYVMETVENVHFVVPTNEELEFQVINLIQDLKIPAYVETDHSKKWDAMAACDASIAVSGTVALELSYIGVPHVIVYKTHFLTYLIVRLLAKVKYAHLGNLILNKRIVPEFLQFQAKAEAISQDVVKLFQDEEFRQTQVGSFDGIRRSLRYKDDGKPSDVAARYVIKIIKTPAKPKSKIAAKNTKVKARSGRSKPKS